MNKVEIYTKSWCPYCARATALLREKGIAFTEIDVSTDARSEHLMRQRSGRHTVPQIFINGHHVGGSDDLLSAEHSGALDDLLNDRATLLH